MKTETLLPSTEGAIWARIVDPESGDLTREAAQTLLQFDFNPADRRRMEELAQKASAGALTPAERRVFEVIGVDGRHVDDVICRSSVPAGAVLEMLLALELRGLIRQLPGKRFCRRAA